MSYLSTTPRTRLGHPATSPSPLRQASTASNGSSNHSNQYPPSRSSTQSSNASNGFGSTGHRRGLSEATALSRPQTEDPADAYSSIRKSLKPLQQAPQASPALEKLTSPTFDLPPRSHSRSSRSISPEKLRSPALELPTRSHSRSQSVESLHTRSQSVENFRYAPYDGSVSPPAKPRPLSLALSRNDSVRAPTRDHSSRPLSTHLEKPELKSFQKSSTGHLRTLSKFAETANDGDFAIKSPEQQVVGLNGRRRLQRTDRAKTTAASWSNRNWMDQQRQFLQAYEYLCHIGEAKEWMEDIIETDLPPVVELEEALRNGVTLAEIVQAVKGQPLRIFRDPKLQYRHSNNYAHFFAFLSEIELPDLFRFELIDLYEKKNVPKVIYCIHALSWLLFRKGIVDFRIGNLVGKLQFEDHELEATQKGLDKSGVSMPNFSGMQANFQVEPEPEPEPEPVESEQDRIDRELAENGDIILDLQAQMRGALVRIRLGNLMQELWDHEHLIMDLQSRIRGDWARQIAYYRLDMRRFAVTLQSAARGFLARSRVQGEEQFWQDHEHQVLKVQNLFRGRKARAQVQYTKSKIQQHDHGIRQFQAAIRGALERLRVCDRYEETRDTEPGVVHVQAMIRGALVRLQVDREWTELQQNEAQIAQLQAASRAVLLRQQVAKEWAELQQVEPQIVQLQATSRAMLVRKQVDRQWTELQQSGSQIAEIQALSRATLLRQTLRADQESLRQNESTVTALQSAVRAFLARSRDAAVQKKLVSTNVNWSGLQSQVRANVLRNSVRQIQEALEVEVPQITDLQAVARAGKMRSEVADILAQLHDQDAVVLSLQSLIRGFLSRQMHFSDLKALQAQTPTILDLQSCCRGFMQRQRTYDTLCELNAQEPEIVDLQAVARGMLSRMQIGVQLGQVEEHEEAIVELQALARGLVIRQKFVEKKQFYKENMEKVIKVQSFIRGRQQGEAYKSLTSGTNPPVSTVKNFVHLLNDNDIDFDEEIGKSDPISREFIVLIIRQSLSACVRLWYNTCDKTSSRSSMSTSSTSRLHC
jgi:Ras GTPase-activating-like protein IQGAP2/3